MKLKYKVLILFGAASLVITAALGTVLYRQLLEDRLLAVQIETLELLRHVEFSLSLFFDEMESDVRALADNELVRSKNDRDFTNFTTADENAFTYRIGPLESRIIGIFHSYRNTHPYASSVYMGRENGGFVRSHKRARPTRYDPRERTWYTLAKNHPDQVMITDPYPSVTTKDVNVGIVKALVDGTGRFYGVVGVDITLEKLAEYIRNFKIGSESRIFVVDRSGIVLAAQARDLLFRRIGEQSKELEAMLLKFDYGHHDVLIAGRQHHVYFRQAPKLGWKIAVLIPSASIEQEIRGPVLQTVTGLVGGLLFLSAVSLLGLSAFVIRPLDALSKETALIAETSDLSRQVPVKTADEIGMLATSFNQMVRSLDVTQGALRKTQQDLLRHQEHLEDLVKERTLELARARDQAQEADRLKSAFLASMSHELRTPLNSIIGFTGILLQGLAGPVNEEQSKQLGMVKNSSHHLLQLINEVLDISKIEAGQLTLDPSWFEMGQAIDQAVKLVRPLADKKGLPIRVDVDPVVGLVFHDRRRVEQVLINLVNNAVKFTEQGEVAVRCEVQQGETIVRVRDTGIGIKPEDMGLLFETFRQIETGLTRRYEGTGLGLSISRRLVELMGGRIWAESEGPGRGSVFAFTLPRKEREDEGEGPDHRGQ